MNELFDITGHLDGYQLLYEGVPIWTGKTPTGAIRAMTAAREAYEAAQRDLNKIILETHRRAA